MAIAMDCEHCGENKVETAVDVWHIKGFLLFASYGSRTYVGCRPCIRSKTLWSLALSSVLGWWCFPWGLGTPVVIAQNFNALADGRSPRATKLRRLLTDAGMDYDDMVLDDAGIPMGDRKMAAALVWGLHRMIWADGQGDEREIQVSVDVLGRMLGPELISAEEARAAFSRKEPPSTEVSFDTLSPDGQNLLMKAACLVAGADGVIEPAEVNVLRSLGESMNLHPHLTDRYIEQLGELGETAPDVRGEAARVLGVPPDAPLPMVRNAYRGRRLEILNHEDEDQIERLAAIASAYEVLTGLPPEAEA